MRECPNCTFFSPLDPPAYDDVGYELVGLCQHPRIAMELFRMKERPVSGGCPCFQPQPSAAG